MKGVYKMSAEKQMEKLSDTALQTALKILDSQYNNCLSERTEEQTAYYIGMKTMLDIIIGFENPIPEYVCYNEFSGTHYIYKKD